MRAVFANYDDDNFIVTVGDKTIKRNDTSGLDIPDGKNCFECDNVLHDYNITMNKKDESTQQTRLQGAMIGQYGMFTANHDSDEYKIQIKEVWSK